MWDLWDLADTARGRTEEQALLSVGVEVAKAPLEVAVWNGGHAVRLGTFHQTADGWVAVRNALTALQSSALAVADAGQGGERPTVEPGAGAEPIAIVLEPTGGYALAFALWARQQPGWQAHRPHPARVRAWARSPGGRAKTDRQDAPLLARFGPSPRCRSGGRSPAREAS